MKNNYLILIMINVNNQLEQQYQLNPLKKTLSYFPIPSESVLLNFTTHRLVGLSVQADYTTFPKLEQSSLGLLQMDHIHYYS